MGTHRSTWKRRERDGAGLFGARRQPGSGSGGRADQTRSDSTHERLFVETKLRAASSVRSLWEQTRDRAPREGKTPVLVLFAKGKPGGLIVTHQDDLAAVAAELARTRPGRRACTDRADRAGPGRRVRRPSPHSGGNRMKRQPTATWSPKQERVALLIAAGRSIKAAALETKCGERTVHGWLDDPRYRSLIAELRNRMLDEAVGSLAEATNEAVGTLRELLDDDHANVRLRAAMGILDAVVRLREHVELEVRITALEATNDDPEGQAETVGEGGDE